MSGCEHKQNSCTGPQPQRCLPKMRSQALKPQAERTMQADEPVASA